MTTAQQMFVTLPVADLDKSVEFFTAVGFEFNPIFTDETATCMVLGENLYAMLLTPEKLRSFTHEHGGRRTGRHDGCQGHAVRRQADDLRRVQVDHCQVGRSRE